MASTRHRQRSRDLSDFEAHERLMHLLQSDPTSVLAHFRGCGIHYLSELSIWHLIVAQYPSSALVIRDVAASMGIPERPGVGVT